MGRLVGWGVTVGVLFVGVLLSPLFLAAGTTASTTATVAAGVQALIRERCATGAPADVPPVEGEGVALVVAAARAAGWTGDDLRVAVALAGAESGFDPAAANDYQAGHVGLWQISGLHGELIAEHGGDRTDPAANARMAYDLWVSVGREWSPTWEAYTNGAWERYLPAADRALTDAAVVVRQAPQVQAAVRSCTPAPGTAPGAVPAGDVAPTGWATPAAGPFTSAYGMRLHPTKGTYRLHGGVDLAPGCGAPVHAAAGGVVTQAGPAESYGTLITIAHADGVTTLYAHSALADHQVTTGDTVQPGQVITAVGTEGDSTGCHLHLEVRVNNERTDPGPFLAARGVDLGPLT